MGQTRLCRADDGLGFDDRKGQAMSATIAQIDLDKLRNIVQKFDAYSFTAALFELADREFREIRDATAQELAEAESPNAYQELEAEEQPSTPPLHTSTAQGEGSTPTLAAAPSERGHQLNAFGFLRIANHFFNDYEFEPHKVDSFTQELNSYRPGLTRTGFNQCMRTHISTVKDYKKQFELLHPGDTMTPYDVIRHCMYLSDRQSYQHLLDADMRQAFELWLSAQEATHTP